MPPTLSPHDFVAKWRVTRTKERSAAQEHFIDLRRMLGVPTPNEADDPRVQAIAQAARDLVEKRDRWLAEGAAQAEAIDPAYLTGLNAPRKKPKKSEARTLTNLYNQRPMWLDLTHRKLDRAVADAYAWPHDLGDDEILGRLLALNLEQAGKDTSVAPPKPESPSDT